MARKIIVGDQEFIVPDKFPKSGFTIGLILVLLLAIWSSIYRVELEEEGVLMTLGEYSGLVQSGIHVKWPAPIQTVIKIPTKRELEMEFGQVAGCIVEEGSILKNKPVRVLRDDVVIHQGELDSLRRFKDDVGEVKSGTECGVGIKNYKDIRPGDKVEVFDRKEEAQSI